jgi:hypothetical protein
VNFKLRRTPFVVGALGLAVALVQLFGGDAAARSNHEGRLQGTWRVHFNPRNCQTGDPIPSFDTLISFARGSTLTEFNSSPAFLPGQRSPGLGVWSRTQGNGYKAVADAFILFDSPVTPPAFGFTRGVQRLMWEFKVHGDQFAIESTSQFYDTNGNPLVATCASGVGTRFEDEMDED